MSNTKRTYPILNNGGQRVRGLRTFCGNERCSTRAEPALLYPERCDEGKPVWRCENCGNDLVRRVRRTKLQLMLDRLEQELLTDV